MEIFVREQKELEKKLKNYQKKLKNYQKNNNNKKIKKKNLFTSYNLLENRPIAQLSQ